MPNVPKKVADRLVKWVGKYQKVLQTAKDRDVNESDTVTIITDILADVFGYNKYSEVTSEQAIRGTYCDLAIEIKGAKKYLIEVKAAGISLKENHLRQAVNYGVNQGTQWVILTNGIVWQIYKIKFDRPVDYDQLCSFNFLDLNARRTEDQDLLFLICKEGLTKAAIEEFDEHVRNVNKFMISAVIQSEPCFTVVKRELKRIAPGVKVDKDEIERILVDDVLKRDVVEGEEAKKAVMRLKKAFGKALRERGTKKPRDTTALVEEPPPDTGTDPTS